MDRRGCGALGDLPGGSIGSWANAVSADGSVVVGESSAAPGRSDAFRWSESEGHDLSRRPGKPCSGRVRRWNDHRRRTRRRGGQARLPLGLGEWSTGSRRSAGPDAP
ncbi:MAG: hypothetical protein IPK00_16035 [Deltaproteobacteria bacterium]|nr:hypothetical protein [Deltaproteobacteria bacterium]